LRAASVELLSAAIAPFICNRASRAAIALRHLQSRFVICNRASSAAIALPQPQTRFITRICTSSTAFGSLHGTIDVKIHEPVQLRLAGG
jgi:hypothetical protein